MATENVTVKINVDASALAAAEARLAALQAKARLTGTMDLGSDLLVPAAAGAATGAAFSGAVGAAGTLAGTLSEWAAGYTGLDAVISSTLAESSINMFYGRGEVNGFDLGQMSNKFFLNKQYRRGKAARERILRLLADHKEKQFYSGEAVKSLYNDLKMVHKGVLSTQNRPVPGNLYNRYIHLPFEFNTPPIEPVPGGGGWAFPLGQPNPITLPQRVGNRFVRRDWNTDPRQLIQRQGPVPTGGSITTPALGYSVGTSKMTVAEAAAAARASLPKRLVSLGAAFTTLMALKRLGDTYTQNTLDNDAMGLGRPTQEIVWGSFKESLAKLHESTFSNISDGSLKVLGGVAALSDVTNAALGKSWSQFSPTSLLPSGRQIARARKDAEAYWASTTNQYRTRDALNEFNQKSKAWNYAFDEALSNAYGDHLDVVDDYVDRMKKVGFSGNRGSIELAIKDQVTTVIKQDIADRFERSRPKPNLKAAVVSGRVN